MIKITEKNEAKIQAELDKVQARCSVRLADFMDVVRAVQLAEKNPVLAIMPKKFHVGTEGRYFPGYGGAIANAYRGVPEETCIVIVRRATGWFFVRAYRTSCVNSERVTLSVPETSVAEAKKRFASCVFSIPKKEEN